MIEKWLAFLNSERDNPHERATRPSFPHSDAWHRHQEEQVAEKSRKQNSPDKDKGDVTVPDKPVSGFWRRRRAALGQSCYEFAGEGCETEK